MRDGARKNMMALLGVDAEYKLRDVITIRGKSYQFYSLAEVWDAARHGLRPYEVTTDRQGSEAG